MATTAHVLQTPSSSAPFERATVERRALGDKDVAIEIRYAGICHSDVHQARDEWAKGIFPMVPGHEIAGVVSEVGSAVTLVKVGDRVGVGCMVDSCGECEQCKDGEEQFCAKGAVLTYNAKDYDGDPTYGGYSDSVVVTEGFVCPIPDGIELDVAAPLLCAGITTYSPLKHWKVGPGSKVGVIGVGGLGHLTIKIAHALGAEVTAFSRSDKKADDAEKLGADHYVAVGDGKPLKALAKTFDVIVNTVSAGIPLDGYLGALKVDGALVHVGASPDSLEFNVFSLIGARRSMAGSNIGGIAETREMLEFCAEHGIGAEIETIPADPDVVDAAYDRVTDGDVRYRFVIDVAGIAG